MYRPKLMFALVVCLGLPAGIWALAVGSLSPQAPAAHDLIFSHRYHLEKAGASCLDCHISSPASTRAEDNNLPKEKTCLVCHDGTRARNSCALCHKNAETAKARIPLHRDFKFNHQLHLGLGNMAPALAAAIDSGRYLSAPGDMRRHLSTGNACLACHRGLNETDFATKENLPKMADCLVCHGKIDPPFSCGYCHTSEARLKPASHTHAFHDLHSNRQAVPDKTTCKVCHGVKFTCMGCH